MSIPAEEVDCYVLTALCVDKIQPLQTSYPCYIALRLSGRLIWETWIGGPDLGEKLQLISRNRALRYDLVELGLTQDYRPVDPTRLTRDLPIRDLGVRGMRLALGCLEERLPPSRMIATNTSFERALERFCDRLGIKPAAFARHGGSIESFDARTLLLPLDGTAPIELYRAGHLVQATEITAEMIERMAREMASWLVRNTDEQGRLPYKYWPSRGAYSTADNTIRQFMATVALSRAARLWNWPDAAQAAQRNLACNLARFLKRCDSGVAVIAYDGTAKLGAAALAALAVLEQEGTQGPHAEALAALSRGIDLLWQPDGSFRTFHHPATRNDNQNFYPGEALLFWASLWQHTGDETLLARFMTSFRYYRAWHRVQRNPAFVPWHTQAYALVYRRRSIPELRDFVFEMNDWLLPLQQGEEAGHPDLVGRFYDPAHRDYGPPHASSTGVYLEGLADALTLAQSEGDEQRAQAYRQAILAGVRNLRQLQFRNRADLYYISRPERVLGAVRTNPYDNTIRVDNVQHGLMALIKILLICSTA